MKKILVMILCLVLALSLVACGGDKETKDTTPETDPVTLPQATDEITEPSEDTSAVTYVVKVEDESGNPFPGIMVQLCNDEGCNPCITEDDGVARFVVPEYRDDYHANVTVLPEGYDYASGQENHYFEENSSELTIVLTPISLGEDEVIEEDPVPEETEELIEEEPITEE